MSRPKKIEFFGAFYHVAATGNRRESIFDDVYQIIPEWRNNVALMQ